MSDIEILNKILARAKINKNLRDAVKELKNAIKSGNKIMAYELSAVKSFVSSGDLKKPSTYRFREDDNYNERALGSSVYRLLDSVHFHIAMETQKIPAGMMIFSAGGIRQKGMPTGKSKTLELIRKEHERAVRETKMKKVI
jgi:hypothetical protein